MRHKLAARFLAVAILAALVVLAEPASAATPPATPHPFGIRDLQGFDRISDPQPSPRGDRIAFVVRTTDFAANRGRNDLWWMRADGTGLTRLTTSEAADTEPRWAPDGRTLFFLSTRSGASQVWSLSLDGGEPQPVTSLPLDVSSLVVSPDGERLLFSLEVFVDCPTLACTAERLAQRAAKGAATGKLYEGGVGFFRHWDAWSEGRRNHLFALPLAVGEPVDLTRGMDADVPSRPFGGAEEIAVSPDGGTVIFAARVAGREEPWSTDFDLYQVPIDGGQPPKNLTDGNPAWDTQPVFSPDGKSLAYLAMTRPGYEADRFHVRLRDLLSGAERELAAAWDRSPNGLVFSPDGRTLYATAADLGNVPLFAIDVASGEVAKLVRDGHVRDPRVMGDRVVFGRDSLRSPVELWSVGRDGAGLVQLTHVDAEKLAKVELGEPAPFHFTGAGGDTVHGWVVKPVGFRAGQRYPLAFLIHGGPQGSFNNEMHYRWNPQVFAGAGYAVVTVDFHGSTGYGQAFTDAIQGEWGGKPFVDLQQGLAAALQQNPWIDGDRACALGGSYGGYMTNWIAGNWPDRFRCLVTHDGIFDLREAYYATEELWFPEHEFGGSYWERPQDYERWNPASFVAKWKTPMLVVHGENDYRLPVTHGIAAFNALQRRGIPGEFLYFPDENHWVLKPSNSVQWYDTVLAWLGRWTKPAAQ
jgi:dipeptidyl aminopeptidase/acylaminoacyl peptidase